MKHWEPEEIRLMLGIVLDLQLMSAIDGKRQRNAQMVTTSATAVGAPCSFLLPMASP